VKKNKPDVIDVDNDIDNNVVVNVNEIDE